MRSRARAWLWLICFAACTSSAQAHTPYDCYGSVGSGLEPKAGPPLVFGLYPLEGAGQVGMPAEPVAVDPAKRAERLRELQPPGKHPLVMHLYTHWRGQQTKLDEQAHLGPLRELTAPGYHAASTGSTASRRTSAGPQRGATGVDAAADARRGLGLPRELQRDRHRFFTLRDADTSSPSFQQHYGRSSSARTPGARGWTGARRSARSSAAATGARTAAAGT